MKISNSRITDQKIIIESEAIIEAELSNGKLYTFKKNYPNGYIELAPSEDKNISCMGNVFNENGELVGRFTITGNQIITSILQIK